LREYTRRDFFGFFRRGTETALAAAVIANWPAHLINEAEAAGLRFADGKYQTFPYQETETGEKVYQLIDWSPLGPDTDTLFGVDLPEGVFPATNVPPIYRVQNPTQERYVFLARNNLQVLQLEPMRGGDRFDMYRADCYGGDRFLDRIARQHAFHSAREHQVVRYLGDIGLFEQQYGQQEQELLRSLIRAQLPPRPDLGIPEPDFAFPRV
jgi:hypothetical protein